MQPLTIIFNECQEEWTVGLNVAAWFSAILFILLLAGHISCLFLPHSSNAKAHFNKSRSNDSTVLIIANLEKLSTFLQP
jgi:hypothetical protein